jgi:hypothetical protein
MKMAQMKRKREKKKGKVPEGASGEEVVAEYGVDPPHLDLVTAGRDADVVVLEHANGGGTRSRLVRLHVVDTRGVERNLAVIGQKK